jgi:hypothetical protein
MTGWTGWTQRLPSGVRNERNRDRLDYLGRRVYRVPRAYVGRSVRPIFLRRVAGRPTRGVMFIDRTPVSHNRLREADILMIIWSVLFGGCFASLVMIAFFGDRVLNALCRG